MRWTREQRGVTLVELMITLVIFTIVISMIYSVFNALIKQATSERKTAKTEMDVINVAWPLLKEIQSAGFGAPKYDCSSTTQCACGIAVSGNDLVIHSTAAGNDQYAGKWSYVGDLGAVTNMYASSGGNNIVVINSTDKSKVSSSPPPAVNSSNVIVTYDSNYVSNVAYWTPYSAVGDLECYETTYRLYDSASPPATCAPGTQTLGRRVSTVAGSGGVNTLPMLDCVFSADADGDRGFNYRFGCISSSGALTWQTGTNCGTSKLRLMKVGIVVQSSMRRDILSTTPIILFEDLASSLQVTINLTADQQAYKWRKLEQTITLKNLE
jgi:prepilin-type N-terminal cleavage/methylation domain-containing protein